MNRSSLASAKALSASLLAGTLLFAAGCASREAADRPAEDGGQAGEAGASPAGAQGAGGAAASTGGAGGGGGEGCAQLASAYADAVPAALTCDVGAAGQCLKQVILSLSCGCRTIVNDSTMLDAVHARWQGMGCSVAPMGCPTGCPPSASAACVLNDAGTGTCVEVIDSEGADGAALDQAVDDAGNMDGQATDTDPTDAGAGDATFPCGPCATHWICGGADASEMDINLVPEDDGCYLSGLAGHKLLEPDGTIMEDGADIARAQKFGPQVGVYYPDGGQWFYCGGLLPCASTQ